MSDSTRKYLWIAAGATAFVLIVAAAATLLFAPSATADRTPFSLGKESEPKQESATDFLADAPAGSESPGSTSADGSSGGKSGDIYIVYGDKEVTSTTVVTVPPAPVQPKATPTTINVLPPTPAAKPPAPTPATTVPAAKPAAPKPVTPAAKPAAAPSAPAASTTSAADWWIQAGIFSVKSNADSLKASFQSKSLQAAISIRDKDGKSYYVVKVGPYPSKAEATKWLSTARSVRGAEQAWVTQ